MSYGIPGSPEGHINGVDLKMEKFSHKFEYHSDINLGIFNTVDFEQGYVQYEHRELATRQLESLENILEEAKSIFIY